MASCRALIDIEFLTPDNEDSSYTTLTRLKLRRTVSPGRQIKACRHVWRRVAADRGTGCRRNSIHSVTKTDEGCVAILYRIQCDDTKLVLRRCKRIVDPPQSMKRTLVTTEMAIESY